MRNPKNGPGQKSASAKEMVPDPPFADFPFCGEEANPVFGDNRHAGRDTKYLEVSPAELIEVAKHLAAQGLDHRESVARAYAIICEAHLISGNIRRWNEKVGRHHSSNLVFNLVEQSQKNEHGQPLREPLLVAFFKALGQGGDATNAAKRFNEWFRQDVRLDDYAATVPWRPDIPGFDQEWHGKLVKTGWISWFDQGSDRYLILPERTEPTGPPARAAKAGEHATRPYWGTGDVWWPEPPKAEVEHRKSEYLNQKRDAFRSSHHARQALEKFERWLQLERLIRKQGKPPKRPRSRKGAFVSPADNGADRGREGRFRRK